MIILPVFYRVNILLRKLALGIHGQSSTELKREVGEFAGPGKQGPRCPRNGKQVKDWQSPLCHTWEGANLESSRLSTCEPGDRPETITEFVRGGRADG